MRCSGVVAYLGNHLTDYRTRRLAAALAFVAASIVVADVHADETVVAKIVVSASPAASYFGERLIEGAMDFNGRKYLLTLQGVAGNVSSVASVYGLRRARDIAGPYTPTTDGLR